VRKLTHNEATALDIIARRGALVPGDAIPDWSQAGLMHALKGLVSKHRVRVEMTDDGPRYTLTDLGRADAS
jgi:hypothetical protein